MIYHFSRPRIKVSIVDWFPVGRSVSIFRCSDLYPTAWTINGLMLLLDQRWNPRCVQALSWLAAGVRWIDSWNRVGQPAEDQVVGSEPSERVRTEQHHELSDYNFQNYFNYIFYPPLYIAGPIITFNNFTSQVSPFSKGSLCSNPGI